MTDYRIGVLTVSDRCSRGETEDKSGPAICAHLRSALCSGDGAPTLSFVSSIVPDEADRIALFIKQWADSDQLNLIVTTGGTGFAKRDITPDVVRPLLDKEAPGVMHAMMAYSLQQTPYAWLSRGVAGVRNRTLIMTLPGSPKAVVECLTPIATNGLRHAMDLAVGEGLDNHPTNSATAQKAAVTSSRPPGCSGACGRGAVQIDASDDGQRKPSVTNRSRISPFPMTPMPEALASIATHSPVPKLVTVSLEKAVGCVLAEDLVSPFPHPPFRASIKDGYAVVSSDGAGVFMVAGALCAGATLPDGFVLTPGQVCRVNTGGPIPTGADAVIQVEDTELLKKRVKSSDARSSVEEELEIRVLKSVSVGNDIRPIGCDLPEGGIALRKGLTLGAPEIGLAASVGAKSLKVWKRPTIAVLSTGDELITECASPCPPEGKIFDSNRSMLLTAATSYSDNVIDAGLAKDEMNDTRSKMRSAFESADVVITTGGVSMGEVDCVKAVLDELGAKTLFGRVNMKPGKPTTFAELNGKIFFALPGNPVSAMVCFYVFVVPALRRMMGIEPDTLPMVTALLLDKVRLDRERPEYHRCKLAFDMTKNCFTATSTGIQASSRLLSMSGANGLIVLPAANAEQSEVQAGEQVQVMMIGSL